MRNDRVLFFALTTPTKQVQWALFLFSGTGTKNFFEKVWESRKKIRQRESERRNLQSRRKIIGNTPSNATPFLRVSEGRFEVIQFTLPKPQMVLVDL